MTTVSGVSANNAGKDGLDISSFVPSTLRNFSFAGWFYPSGNAILLNMAKVSGATDMILESKGGHYRFWINYSEAHDHTGGEFSSAWAFVGITVDGSGNLKMWRGADMESFSLTADLDTITEVRVGASTYDNNPASYIGPFAFWNSAISDANMDAMAAGGNLGDYSPTQYFDDLSGASPHTAAIGSGSATEVLALGDAPSDPPMDVSAVPEIAISGDSTEITDGDSTPSVSDDTDFGTLEANSDTEDHTFTIANSGSATLTLSGDPKVALSGAGSSHFSVTAQPSGTVAAAGSTTFTIRYAPTASGTHTATVTVTSDDADEGTYTFDIEGEGVTGAAVDAGDAEGVNAGVLLTASPDVSAGSSAITTYLWEATVVPEGGAVVFSDASIEAPDVGFTLAGEYTLKLTVTDANAIAKNDTVVVTVAAGGGSSSFGSLTGPLNMGLFSISS